MTIKETLENYIKEDIYPFHMPGHKRLLESKNPYAIDMTEVENVDDLHDPSGPIARDQGRIARLYGSHSSYILVGGSTVGNLAAIYAACNEGDKILIQRNSHKSVYNALTLRHLSVDYLYPEIGENGIYRAVTKEEIKGKLDEDRDIKALVITSPTYEGYHSPIKEIGEICHKRGVILIVDQAHGAHLGFDENFKNPAAAYADITIQSLHKTLPSLTQTAILHIKGDRVSPEKIREALDIFETSSPSYVLMHSVSNCVDILENSRDIFREYMDKLEDFYQKSAKLLHIKIIQESTEIKDPGKIIIDCSKTNITGSDLAEKLRRDYKIETELSSFGYVLAMTSIMDTKEGFDRLENALRIIDEKLSEGRIQVPDIGARGQKVMEPWEAKAGMERKLPLDEAIGRVSAAMVCLYPPGSPLLVPGEVIKEESLEIIREARDKNIHVTGLFEDFVSIVSKGE
ncbi:MAG: aminotransferase class I/II-fold pyridoxal phosphate-dependent enzyme [Pseudobutyrivibrio sp.]|nr:aminotransferase class I/II-fold pyridoxal phosphate-dependent enzyme [Pseudobutyrivibrio sp.]